MERWECCERALVYIYSYVVSIKVFNVFLFIILIELYLQDSFKPLVSISPNARWAATLETFVICFNIKVLMEQTT